MNCAAGTPECPPPYVVLRAGTGSAQAAHRSTHLQTADRSGKRRAIQARCEQASPHRLHVATRLYVAPLPVYGGGLPPSQTEAAATARRPSACSLACAGSGGCTPRPAEPPARGTGALDTLHGRS